MNTSEYFCKLFENFVYCLGDIVKETGMTPKYFVLKIKLSEQKDNGDHIGNLVWEIEECEFENEQPTDQ